MENEMMKCFARHKRFNDDGLSTRTSIEQIRVEKSVDDRYDEFDNLNLNNDGDTLNRIKLFRQKHIEYLKNGLFKPLDHHFDVLDISRTWMVYWISLSLHLLGESKYLHENSEKIVNFLRNCQSINQNDGGYGGGPNQYPHLASTYAAVNALVTLGSPKAFDSINVKKIEKFLYKMQQPNGSFTLHESGEIDIRGVYCAASVAKLLMIPIYPESTLFQHTPEWIKQCQTYEGGFGATPGNEAHGGYTFCAVAALALLDKLDSQHCDLDSLIRWTIQRQQSYEGGFSGRSNKLVDGCYSFWMGAILPIVQSYRVNKDQMIPLDRWLFNQESLQEYILMCCQQSLNKSNGGGGGLRDKPGKNPDFYHTCYTLSGLSIAQYCPNNNETITIGSSDDNLLEPIHPIFNVPIQSLKSLRDYFHNKK